MAHNCLTTAPSTQILPLLTISNRYGCVLTAVSQSTIVYVAAIVLFCMVAPSLAYADINFEPKRGSTLLSKLGGTAFMPLRNEKTIAGGLQHTLHAPLIHLVADASIPKSTPHTKLNHTPHNKKTKHRHHKIKHKHHVIPTIYIKNHVADKMPEIPRMPAADKLEPKVVPEMTKMPQMPNL